MFGKNLKKEIIIEGMRCNHCAKKVEDTLLKINGVKKVSADFNTGKVEITSKTEIAQNDIVDAIESLGYSVK